MGKINTEFEGCALSLALLSNGDLVSCGIDGNINIWNTDDGTLKQTLTGLKNDIWGLISIDDNCLISVSGNTIKIWNINQGKAEKTLTGHTEKV